MFKKSRKRKSARNAAKNIEEQKGRRKQVHVIVTIKLKKKNYQKSHKNPKKKTNQKRLLQTMKKHLGFNGGAV